MLIDDVAYIMDDMPERDDQWLDYYLNGTRKGVVRLNGITVAKKEIIDAYLKQPIATAYVPWRDEEVTAKRIEFTTGKHSPLMFHAMINSHMKHNRFEEGIEAVELLPMNFLFGLAPTVGTEEINPVTAHFLHETRYLFRYYFDGKEKLKCYNGLSKSAIYHGMAHIAALQKMVTYSKLVDDLPVKILKDKPLPVYKWLLENEK